MTEQTTPETFVFPTPAQDRRAACEEDYKDFKRVAIEGETKWLEKQSVAALRQVSLVERTPFIKSTDNKGTLIRKIAEHRWNQSQTKADYVEIRNEAHREEEALAALAKADEPVEQAREVVRKVLGGADTWFLADSLARAAVQVAYAVEARRAWGNVKTRIEAGAEPLEAVEETAKELTRRALSDARDGVARSAEITSRLSAEAAHQGTLRWVDEARRYVPALSDLFKW